MSRIVIVILLITVYSPLEVHTPWQNICFPLQYQYQYTWTRQRILMDHPPLHVSPLSMLPLLHPNWIIDSAPSLGMRVTRQARMVEWGNRPLSLSSSHPTAHQYFLAHSIAVASISYKEYTKTRN
jgi:hypothetical protein